MEYQLSNISMVMFIMDNGKMINLMDMEFILRRLKDVHMKETFLMVKRVGRGDKNGPMGANIMGHLKMANLMVLGYINGAKKLNIKVIGKITW